MRDIKSLIEDVTDVLTAGAQSEDTTEVATSTTEPPGATKSEARQQLEYWAAMVAEEEEAVAEQGLAERLWIQKSIKHPGALHKQLHVPAGEKIPLAKEKAAAEKGGTLGKRARLALTLRKISQNK